ncbi:YCF48-related protein [Uliginosibacterium sp. H3]|uniref:YCF48-related protein n=1 Tax=Uliginosibacterium silvisoli TaxID=3114758 RepID=A0ABU6K4Q1_9RHOO|nr:YCF48-related protein [Uliginosibacterium sp. H3]
MRTMTNTASLDRGNTVYFNQWQSVRLTDAQGKQVELLPWGQSGQSNTQIFAAQLPAGQYKLHSLYARLIGGITVPLESLQESFEVQASRTTGLGTVIVQPTGNRETTVLRDYNSSSLARIYREAYGPLARLPGSGDLLASSGAGGNDVGGVRKGGVVVVSNSVSVGAIGTLFLAGMQSLVDHASATEVVEAWRKEKDPNKRIEMAKDSTYRFNSPKMLPDGSLIAGSGLGQLLLRSPDGKWKRLDTGDMRDLTAVTPLDNDHILVGGEEGFVIETGDGGKSWQALPPLPVKSVVTNLQRYRDSTMALVVEGDDDAVLYELKPGAAWIELKREAKVFAWPGHPPTANAGALLLENRYIMLTGNSSLNILDMNTRQWTTRKTPFNAAQWGPSYSLRATNKGVVYALGARTSYLTSDWGATWQDRGNACLRLMDAWITGTDTSFNFCAAGSFVVSTTIERKPTPQGSWSTASTTPVLTGGWFVSDDAKLIVIAGTEGVLYSSSDSGETWKLERTPLN